MRALKIAPRELQLGKSSVIVSSTPTLLSAVVAASFVLAPVRAQAQWWSRAPVDFEECADSADKATTREARKAALSECHSKFAGRRKPGGGYSYFDFMQNRSFDLAGPNPTPEEQKHIDEQYTEFLDRERRSTIAAAFTARQRQVQQTPPGQAAPKQISQRNDNAPTQPLPPAKPRAATTDIRSRGKAAGCTTHTFSCDWPRLSEGLKDLKKLFGSSEAKAKRG
jgi:hypothetical protein